MFKGTHKKIRNIKHRTVTKSPTKDFREKVTYSDKNKKTIKTFKVKFTESWTRRDLQFIRALFLVLATGINKKKLKL